VLSAATSKKILKEDEQNTPYHQAHDNLPFCSSRFSYNTAIFGCIQPSDLSSKQTEINLRDTDHVEDLGTNGKIILKLIFKK
jgi:hypothetical protein